MAAESTGARGEAHDVLTAEEVAELLRTHVITVYRMAEGGQLPGFKVGTRWRFRRQAMEEWCRTREEASRPWVLVVDDQPAIRDLFIEYGRLAGVETMFSEDGEQAVGACQGQRFSLVFLDLVLPGMDGVEVMKRVRELQADTPIVLMTGYPTHELLDEAVKLGPMKIIHKPFDFGEIQTILQTVAAQRA